MKILTVIGARPQFIKAMALSHTVARSSGVEEVLLHTGQHYDDNMSAVFFRDLRLAEPKYRFDLGGGSHGQMTGRQLEAIEEALIAEKPDVCLVYGDTNSTLAGSLAAAKLHIPVAHVEAGLRSFNRRMPEEINRILTDHVATWLFAPTETAVRNLANEGIADDNVHLVGDVMYDVARLVIDHPERRTDILERLGLSSEDYAVSTLHRQENTDDPGRLAEILEALAELAGRMKVVLPLHPRTRKTVTGDARAKRALEKMITIDPVGFFDMATLLSVARLAITDSGGLQKEAFFHGVPCVTVREETEWVELVELGWNRLPASITGTAIAEAIEAALAAPPGKNTAAYGHGDAANKLLEVLVAGRSGTQ
ncbi:MAG: UDP-N-acetylglucosamine 2-epimerase (non-hydrolyzing) [Rhizobiaceae bacterium]|uniref:non-hydrolyzing UDP-N-acetylglucosamine 2-epimerase n=1 Tax=Parvibaculum sp. TaxID=2024848 RepID=UPI001B000676|nr:UDP-N-acetylglucosamine 2-epimerase (non-hydrolyzing) [Parvibaculum sp.]MBO6633393.1 UDP-N-acetylglucosamine 2-epimerase (non-hydrolyzing) [Parvibaculum sp.]MBO6725862.1 UDP-N-acetylglucosamine 2-epimerase (non-hydrolyzing) [Rhizobiaceae bacterium]